MAFRPGAGLSVLSPLDFYSGPDTWPQPSRVTFIGGACVPLCSVGRLLARSRLVESLALCFSSFALSICHRLGLPGSLMAHLTCSRASRSRS
jgi:hypothetical protein